MNLISGSGRLAVTPIAPGAFENLSTTTATALESGFVVVYVDNQTIGKDVWFDNVQETSHILPFQVFSPKKTAGIN